MNKQQLTYFCDRIEELRKQAELEVRKNHTNPRICMSNEEKEKLLASVGLRSPNHIAYMRHVSDQEEHLSHLGEQLTAAIKKSCQSAKDIVMLDNQHATNALTDLVAELNSLLTTGTI